MSTTRIRHVHLLVADHERAVAFYTEAFEMVEVLRTGLLVILTTPGSGDTSSLHLATSGSEGERVGQRGGYEHFGIYVGGYLRPLIDEAVARVEHAGGRLAERGQHAPGVPYAFSADPDGYTSRSKAHPHRRTGEADEVNVPTPAFPSREGSRFRDEWLASRGTRSQL
jgi:catechol 2,3-dioxygenase-like lactoylglutathione lyase family enzyme